MSYNVRNKLATDAKHHQQDIVISSAMLSDMNLISPAPSRGRGSTGDMFPHNQQHRTRGSQAYERSSDTDTSNAYGHNVPLPRRRPNRKRYKLKSDNETERIEPSFESPEYNHSNSKLGKMKGIHDNEKRKHTGSSSGETVSLPMFDALSVVTQPYIDKVLKWDDNPKNAESQMDKFLPASSAMKSLNCYNFDYGLYKNSKHKKVKGEEDEISIPKASTEDFADFDNGPSIHSKYFPKRRSNNRLMKANKGSSKDGTSDADFAYRGKANTKQLHGANSLPLLAYHPEKSDFLPSVKPCSMHSKDTLTDRDFLLWRSTHHGGSSHRSENLMATTPRPHRENDASPYPEPTRPINEVMNDGLKLNGKIRFAPKLPSAKLVGQRLVQNWLKS
ncbi:unnamed protein product [Owenia fusiformis]|uniref:Uncharacterized protein n=1 Tax=Owenia fusiformis TaxID=6347 RepID=A0A8J1UBR4_OWEFU|nr:unnamed protein product [Owenia fusiformis]